MTDHTHVTQTIKTHKQVNIWSFKEILSFKFLVKIEPNKLICQKDQNDEY